jgi:hypothetical protein
VVPKSWLEEVLKFYESLSRFKQKLWNAHHSLSCSMLDSDSAKSMNRDDGRGVEKGRMWEGFGSKN